MTSPIVASGTQIRTVVVTGGAPYKQWKFNTSSMIRDGLPDTLVGHDKSNINILRYPKDIVCKYMDALSEVPKIWSGKREEFEPQDGAKGRVHIDALIHIGMNPGSSAYSLEKRARRDGYEEPGEDGVYLPPSTFNGLPEELHPWFDLDDVAHRLSKELPDSTSVKTSDDAGLYFCELQLYLSLAELHRREELKRVVFLHVPGEKDSGAIQQGVEVACALIKRLVASLPTT